MRARVNACSFNVSRNWRTRAVRMEFQLNVTTFFRRCRPYVVAQRWVFSYDLWTFATPLICLWVCKALSDASMSVCACVSVLAWDCKSHANVNRHNDMRCVRFFSLHWFAFGLFRSGYKHLGRFMSFCKVLNMTLLTSPCGSYVGGMDHEMNWRRWFSL